MGIARVCRQSASTLVRSDLHELVKGAQQRYARNGVAIVPSFLTARALESARQEAAVLSPGAFVCERKHDAFLRTVGDEDEEQLTTVASIAADELSCVVGEGKRPST